MLTVAYGVPLPEATAIALLDRVISVFSIIVIGSIAYAASSQAERPRRIPVGSDADAPRDARRRAGALRRDLAVRGRARVRPSAGRAQHPARDRTAPTARATPTLARPVTRYQRVI